MSHTDYTMPANLDAERAVLGGVLLNNECLPDALADLATSDFSSDSHCRIYGAMLALHEDGREIDHITIAEVLRRRNELETVGGQVYVASLADGMPFRSSVKQHVAFVKEKAQLRRLINTCESMIGRAAAQAEAPEICIAGLQEQLLAMVADGDEGTQHVREFSSRVLLELHKRRDRKADLVGLSLGVECIDKATGGIRPQELWFLAGRPGRGKTAIAVQAAIANAAEGHPVWIASLEMSKAQFLERVWAQVARVPAERIKFSDQLTVEELERVEAAVRQVATWPLFIDDRSGTTISELVSRAILGVKRHGAQLVIVDHIHELNYNEEKETAALNRIASELKRLSKEYAPVLALAQLDRPTDHNLNKRPNFTELRGSGMLEAKANTILLVHWPLDSLEQPTREDEIVIAKQREGGTGIEHVAFDDELLLYRARHIMPVRSKAAGAGR